MSNIIYITDIHLKDVSPVSRKDDYAQAILAKIEKTCKLAEKKKSSALILGGDVFDVKDSRKISYWLTNQLLDMFKAFPCPVYSIIGNHDIKYDRLDTIDEQPLGTLFKSGIVKHLKSLIIDNVEFIGRDFTPHNKTSISDFIVEKTTKKQVLVTHHNLFIKTTDFFGEKAITYQQLSEQINADVVLNGHIHYPEDGKYIVKIGDKQYCNPGSLSRGSLSDDNLERNVQAVFLELDDLKINLVNLQAKPASEVFDVQSKEDRIEKSEKIKEFVESLRDSTNSAEGESVDSIMKSMKLSKLVRDKVEHYLSIAGEK